MRRWLPLALIPLAVVLAFLVRGDSARDGFTQHGLEDFPFEGVPRKTDTFVFRNRVGTWTIRDGYVQRLVLANGKLATEDVAPVRHDPSFLNDPLYGGIGDFGYFYGEPPWSYHRTADNRSLSDRAVRRFKAFVDAHTYDQRFQMPEGFTLHYRWKFYPRTVYLYGTLVVREGSGFVKEPKVAFNLNRLGQLAVSTLGDTRGRCLPELLKNPMKHTAHCIEPGRTGFTLGPLRVVVHDDELRQLGRDARAWPRGGDSRCGKAALYTYPRWEYVGWASGGTTAIVKAWEGCIGVDDGLTWYRKLPAGPRVYRFSFAITEVS